MDVDIQLLVLPPKDAANLREIRKLMRLAGATAITLQAKRGAVERARFEERWGFLPTLRRQKHNTVGTT